jgi:hypothetical protein
MSITRILAATGLLIAHTCLAQTYTFDPPSPKPGEAFTIKATWPNSGASVQTQGYLLSSPVPPEAGKINVWFVQDGFGFATPPPGLVITASQTIPGVPAGIYTVSITWVADPSTLVPAANSPQTFQLTVGGDSNVAPGPFAISNGITGNWYDPDEAGHGFSLEVLPGGTLLAEWFVFAPNGGHDWVVATGPINGNIATLNAYRADGPGGLFPPLFDASALTESPWGTITFQFSDCDNGTVSWQSSIDGYGAGTLPIKRLTSPAGQHCP